MPADPHTRLLTSAAREVLQPLGLRQRGRSRTWLDDHGWWLGVVEFQPSSWAKGSYLNVGGMWLWQEPGHHVAFDVGHRVDGAGFIEYRSDDQFAPEARRLAVLASEEIQRLRITLSDLDAAIAWLRDHSEGRQGWPGYNLGVALRLGGHQTESAKTLRGLAQEADDPEWRHRAVARAHELGDLIDRDSAAFRAEIHSAITACRASLRLEPHAPSL